MGDQDHQYDSTNSNQNGSNPTFGTNSLLMASNNNNSYLPHHYQRMDISSRVGKDITNLLQNQHHNTLAMKHSISNNMDDGKLQSNMMQKSLQYNRNHNRTTSSILLAAGNKDKKEGKKFEDFSQQQSQLNNQKQKKTGFPKNVSQCSNNTNNMKVNKSGNFAQITSNYHQMNKIAEQFSCEKENNNQYATQFHQQQQTSQIQNSQYTNNFMSNNSSNLLCNNNNNNKSNINMNIFTSQAVSSSFNQPLSTLTSFPSMQPAQNKEQSQEMLTSEPSQQTSSEESSTVAPHQAHLEYTREIIAHMRATENNFSSKGGYMGGFQKEINERMRSILLDWLVDVHFKFKLHTETLFISINLIDRYLEKVALESSKLQLLGITSLFIAAKYEEVYSVPHINDLVYVCDNAYKKEEIFEMEGSILHVLNFNILSVSSFRLLDYFIQFDELGEKNYYLARYFIEIALLEYKMVGHAPSLIASASIYLVNKIRKRPVAWKESMVEITGYNEQDIRPCAKQICYIVQTIDTYKYLNSLRKKFQKPQFLEVAKIRIEQRREFANNNNTSNTSNNNNSNNGFAWGFKKSQNLTNSTSGPFQQCASKDQEIIPEPSPECTNYTNNSSNLVFNNNNVSSSSNIVNQALTTSTNFSQQNQNNISGGIPHSMSIPDQQLQQVEYVDITVPLQAAIYLIDRRVATLKEKPSGLVWDILASRFQGEGAQPVELKVPTQMIIFMIEKKITNIPNKQLWQLPVRLAKIVSNSMLNPDKIQDLSFIPVEFVTFMIDTIVNEQIRMSQNSQRNYFSNNSNSNNTPAMSNGNGNGYQFFFNNNQN